MKRAATAIVVLMALVSPTNASAQLVLLGGGSGANSPLYLIDPSNGTATPIGNIGFGITGIAQHPLTGAIYAVTAQAPAGVFTRQLLRIDPSTGAGTVIGPIGLGAGGVADIAFRSDGTLFGWSESSDDLITINLATGAGTVVGNSGISTRGSGLAFDSSGTLFFAGNNANGALRTVNTTTGLTTVVATLNGSPAPTQPIAAMKFLPGSNVIYAINRILLQFQPGGPASNLVTINPATGQITNIGATAPSMDALAWIQLPRTLAPPPTISEVIPSSGPSVGGTQVTLRGSDFSTDRRTQVTFGGVPATNVVIVNSSTITATTPAGPAGAVDVTAVNNDGLSSTLRNGFTYIAPPPTTVSLTVQLRGFGSGRVVSAPAGISCGSDCTEAYTDTAATQVQLVAIPAADATFVGWTGDADCSDGTVTMIASRSCSARFEKLPDGRPLDIDGDGRGDVVGYRLGAADEGRSQLVVLRSFAGVLRGGDVNGDRRSDIISYDPATGAWSIELGGANVLNGTASARQSPLIVDVNGDRAADVVFHDAATGQVQPCAVAGGGLNCRAASAVGSSVSVIPFDLNGDGRGDLLTYQWATGAIGFLLGNAGGTFDASGQSLGVAANRQLLVLDVNGDSRSDLIVSDPAGGATTLYVNGGGGFTTLDLGVLPGFSLHVVSLDGDARSDLIAYQPATGQTLQALNAGGRFTVVSSSLPAGRQVVLTDLNGDRRSDLILYDPNSGAVTVAISEANGTFTQQPSSGPPGLQILSQQGAP
jgi:hypothetical protein